MERAADQQRLLKAGLLGGQQAYQRPVIEARALGPIARREPLPLLARHGVLRDLLGRQVIVRAAPGQINAVIASDRQYVGLPPLLEPAAQGTAAPLDPVTGHPS